MINDFSEDKPSSIVMEVVRYIQFGIAGMRQEQKKLIKSSNAKLKVAVVMIILFLVFIFLDQLVFKNDRRVGERKKPGKAEKHKKAKNRKNVR